MFLAVKLFVCLSVHLHAIIFDPRYEYVSYSNAPTHYAGYREMK